MALINLYISHDEFVLVNNVLREYDDMKDEIKNLKTSSIYKTMLSCCLECRKNTESKNPKVVLMKNYVFVKMCSV